MPAILTSLELKITSSGKDAKIWDLARDISGNVLAGNPQADRFGNPGVWHFYTEPDKGAAALGPTIPAGSLLAKWQTAQGAESKTEAGRERAEAARLRAARRQKQSRWGTLIASSCR